MDSIQYPTEDCPEPEHSDPLGPPGLQLEQEMKALPELDRRLKLEGFEAPETAPENPAKETSTASHEVKEEEMERQSPYDVDEKETSKSCPSSIGIETRVASSSCVSSASRCAKSMT